jgi:hypothetical protein
MSSASLSTQEFPLALTRRRMVLLGAFSATIIFNIALQNYVWGGLALALSLWLIVRDPQPALRRRLAVLLGCVVVLTITDINTRLSNANFLQVGLPFALVVFLPAAILSRTDPGVIRFSLWPRRFRRADVIYVLISVPLAFAILKFYWWVNPFMPTHWALPANADHEQTLRLFLGINAVGIWDELFFVNTSFTILRSLFPFRTANTVQAVLYTCVLYDMAFTGIGPLVVFGFAWTQGAMYEGSENLLYVLLVHLIVDAFLVAAILGHYYPGS